MKNEEKWEASILIKDGNKYVVNTDHVGNHSIYVVSKKLPIYISNISKYVKGDFLDCGCGKQPYYGIYKGKVDSITSVDWSNSMHDNIHLDYIMDLNQELSFESNTFDSILLSDVLEHISDPDRLLKELTRILRPEGRLLIFVPFLYWLHEEPYDFFRYTEHYFRSRADKFNCSIKRLESLGGLVDVVFDFLNKTALRKSRFFINLLIKTSQLSIVKKYNSKSSKSFPWGYFVLIEKK